MAAASLVLIIMLHMISIESFDSSTIFGITTKDAALLTSSSNFSPNGFTIKHDYESIKMIGNNMLIALVGDDSDCNYLYDYLENQNLLHQLSYQNDMSCKTLSNLCRRFLYESLRSPQSLNVNILIAGWDRLRNKPSLFWIDKLASIQEVEDATHGSGTTSILSILDQVKNQLQQSTMQSGVDLILKCWDNLTLRSNKNIGKIKIKAVTAAGIVEIQ